MNKLFVTTMLALTFAAQHARAGTVTYEFRATVTFVDSSLSGSFSSGALVTGSFTLDTSVADASALTTLGGYPGALTDLTTTFGSYTASSTSGDVRVENNHLGSDSFLVRSSAPALVGPDLGDRQLIDFQFTVSGSATWNLLSSDAIPTTAPNLDSATFARDVRLFFLGGDDGGNSKQVIARLDSLSTVNTVPEPSSFVLCLTAIAAVATRYRTRRTAIPG